MNTKIAVEMISELVEFTFRNNGQAEKLAAVLKKHPDAKLVRCSDEYTGVRFANSYDRLKRCKKIGRTTYVYQLWAIWGGPTHGYNSI